MLTLHSAMSIIVIFNYVHISLHSALSKIITFSYVHIKFNNVQNYYIPVQQCRYWIQQFLELLHSALSILHSTMSRIITFRDVYITFNYVHITSSYVQSHARPHIKSGKLFREIPFKIAVLFNLVFTLSPFVNVISKWHACFHFLIFLSTSLWNNYLSFLLELIEFRRNLPTWEYFVKYPHFVWRFQGY